MTILNILVVIFVIFTFSRVILRFNSKEISLRETFFWSIIWLSVLIIALFPDITTNIAETIGMGRGLDSVVLMAILILFYLIFRLYIKIEALDKDITNLNMELTKKIHSKKDKS